MIILFRRRRHEVKAYYFCALDVYERNIFVLLMYYIQQLGECVIINNAVHVLLLCCALYACICTGHETTLGMLITRYILRGYYHD